MTTEIHGHHANPMPKNQKAPAFLSAVRASLHERVVAGLRPDGVFILEAYTPDQLVHETGGPSSVDLLMTSAALKRELSGLELAVQREVERDVIEGSFHTGRAAVVQIAGCRPVG